MSQFASHHESFFFESGSGPVENKHWFDPKIQKFAYPPEKPIDHLEIIRRRGIVFTTVLSILDHIQELDNPDGHVDGKHFTL